MAVEMNEMARVLPPLWLASDPVSEDADETTVPANTRARATGATFLASGEGRRTQRVPAWLAEGSHGNNPLPPSALPASLRVETVLFYDGQELVRLARLMLLTPEQYAAGTALSELHLLPADE